MALNLFDLYLMIIILYSKQWHRENSLHTFILFDVASTMTASTTCTNKQRPHIAIIMRVTTTLRWAMGRSCNMTFSLRVIPSCFNVAFAIIVLVTFRLAISNWARTKATLMVTLIRDATTMSIPNMFVCIYNRNKPL